MTTGGTWHVHPHSQAVSVTYSISVMSLLFRSPWSPELAVHLRQPPHRRFLELFWKFFQGLYTSHTSKSFLGHILFFNSNHHFPA